MAKKPKPKPVKRSKKGAPALPSWWQPGFVPCVARDPASAVGAPFNRVYMLAATFEGTLAVQRWANVGGMLGVRDRIIHASQMKHYTHEDTSLQSALEELKPQMLAEGATPEAVRLVSEFISFTEEEYRVMADKLSKRAAPKKAAADKKSTGAAAKAPKQTQEKGAAPSRAPVDFNYKTTMTKKEAAEKFRAGTWTARMVDIILNNKSSAAARLELEKDKDFGDKRIDFGWAEKQGIITKS